MLEKNRNGLRAPIALLLAAGILVTSSTGWAARTAIEDIRLSSEPGKTRLVLDLSDEVSYTIFPLSNPDRLVIDLQNASIAASPRGLNFSGSAISKLRHGVQPGSTMRLVLDLTQTVAPSSFILPPADGKGPRLVVDLYDPHTAPANLGIYAEPPSAPARPEPQPRPAVREPPITPQTSNADVAALELQPNHSSISSFTPPAPLAPPITATSVANPVPAAPVEAPVSVASLTPVLSADSITSQGRDVIVAIDAGHGGKDAGALGTNGTREKDVVLAIARKFKELVNREPGMRAVMIRDADIFVPLRDRIDIARKYNADLFISIHADAFPRDKRVHGSSVYVLSHRGATSEAARWLAQRENASDLVGGVSLDDKDPLLRSVLLDLAQSATSEASSELAHTMISHLGTAGKVHRKRVEGAGFLVLKSPDIPSILVETAYVTNASDEARLRSFTGQQKIAQSLMNGVRSFLSRNAPPGTTVASRNKQQHAHLIRNGESLSSIAERYHVSVNDLRASNSLNSDQVRAGETLLIPVDG